MSFIPWNVVVVVVVVDDDDHDDNDHDHQDEDHDRDDDDDDDDNDDRDDDYENVHGSAYLVPAWQSVSWISMELTLIIRVQFAQ